MIARLQQVEWGHTLRSKPPAATDARQSGQIPVYLVKLDGKREAIRNCVDGQPLCSNNTATYSEYVLQIVNRFNE